MLELARAGSSIIPAREQQVLARMEAARDELSRARNIGEAKRVADGAAAICEWLRRQSELGLEIVNDGQLLKLQAEARMGEFLRQPGAVKRDGRPGKPCQDDTVSSPPTHKALGIDRKAAQRYREVAAVPAARLGEMAREATAKGKELTRESVLKVAQKLKVAAVVDLPTDEAPPLCPAIPEALRNTIITGDARELAAEIPDASIAVCFTDPIYWNTEDYAWLARECERVLIPGGSVIAQVGNVQRFEAECAMRASGLQWVDLLAEVYPLAMCGLHHVRIQIGWKPYLWFSKGDRVDLNGKNLHAPDCKTPNSGWIMNRVHAKGKRSADASKDLHEWGDAEEFANGLLVRLCCPGDVVWDPFAGSGLVPTVCKRLGLPFVASEIVPEKAQAGRDRLAGVRRQGRVSQGALQWDDAA